MAPTHKTVYVAGKITGDPGYRQKFAAAERELTAAGYVVLNPAMLPPSGFTYDAYMRMTTAMMDECMEVCFFPDWLESKGALSELGRALAQGKIVFMYATWEAERAGRAEHAGE
jgi:hypothetical protein